MNINSLINFFNIAGNNILQNVSKFLGIEPGTVYKAEQSFIKSMNDEKIREKISKSLLRGQNRYLYKGSFSVNYEETIYSTNKLNTNEFELVKKLNNLNYDYKNIVFTIAGCINQNDTKIRHYLAFALEKEEKKIYCFCPEWNILHKETINIVLRCVKKAFIDMELVFVNKSQGPQDVTNRWYPTMNNLIPPLLKGTDSFSQTWVLLWLKFWVHNNTNDWETLWGSSPEELTRTIRYFIIDILSIANNTGFTIIDDEDSDILSKYFVDK